MPNNVIFTIGHSTLSLEEFISLLKSVDIQLLADIRSYPGSKRHPHFNKEQLEVTLPKSGINYLHFKDLGGRRVAKPDSTNTSRKVLAFRGYADHMDTPTFKTAVEQLEERAGILPTAYMCSEATWRNCHRSLLSDYLKLKGWHVMHILKEGQKSEEHPYSKSMYILDGKLNYGMPDLFS